MLADNVRDALRTAQRIRERVALVPSPSMGQVTVSVGVACLDPVQNTLEKLIEAADRGMYRAERAGKNRVASARAILRAQEPTSAWNRCTARARKAETASIASPELI